MNTHRSFIRLLLVSVLAGLLMACAGVARAGSLTALRTSAEKSIEEPEGDGTTRPSDDDGIIKPGDANDEGDGTTRPSDDDGIIKPGDANDEGDGTTRPSDDDGIIKPGNPADREAECRQAAGSSTVSGRQSGTDGAVNGTATVVRKTGLDHAIDVVLANCVKNPQAPGLLNALRHLVQNRDRHLAHQIEKSARRAAREAAKSGRHGKTAHGRGHS
jgi:hypothetical protein